MNKQDKIKKIQDALENWTDITLSGSQIIALATAINLSDEDVAEAFQDLIDESGEGDSDV